MLGPVGIAIWLLVASNTLALPSHHPRAARNAGAFSSSCQAVTTQNNADFHRCRRGKITWVNSRGSRRLVFDQCGRDFNLCLHVKQSPSAAVDVLIVRNSLGVVNNSTRFCYASYGGNVILDLRTRHGANPESTLEIEYTASIAYQKTWSTCEADCMCNRDHVVAATIISAIGFKGNLFAYRALIASHYKYKQTLNPFFVPVRNSVSPSHIGASLRTAPRLVEVTSMCEMDIGQTYFLAGDNNPHPISSSRMSLRTCCMAQSYKMALRRYVMKCF